MMATVRRFEELEIWQMAREQARSLFTLATKGDFSKDYSFRNQIMAASGSVMDNIAEGFDRFSKKEFLQFLVIAKGSNAEVRSQIYRAYDFGYFSNEEFESKLAFTERISIKLNALIRYLRNSKLSSKPTTH